MAYTLCYISLSTIKTCLALCLALSNRFQAWIEKQNKATNQIDKIIRIETSVKIDQNWSLFLLLCQWIDFDEAHTHIHTDCWYCCWAQMHRSLKLWIKSYNESDGSRKKSNCVVINETTVDGMPIVNGLSSVYIRLSNVSTRLFHSDAVIRTSFTLVGWHLMVGSSLSPQRMARIYKVNMKQIAISWSVLWQNRSFLFFQDLLLLLNTFVRVEHVYRICSVDRFWN